MIKNLIDFQIGSDPEIYCSNKGRMVSADDYVGIDDELGCDGCNDIWEIRHEPDKDPIKITNKIRDVMVRKMVGHKHLLQYNWTAGSYHNGFALGGHIHFGIKPRIINPAIACRYLDNYLGAITLLIENKKEGRSRRMREYGLMSDFRAQSYGFEYRTPSSWLTSPYVTSAVLCLAKTIMYEVLNNRSFKWNIYTESQTFRYMDAGGHVRQNFSALWLDITKMYLYQRYKPFIDVLYFLVNNQLSWYPAVSFKEAWGLVDLSKYHNRDAKLKTIWHRYLLQNSETS